MQTCKQCSRNVKIYIRCLKCDGIYHPKCLGKVPAVYVNVQGHVICCRNIISIQNNSQGNSDVPKDPKRKVKEKCSYKCDNGLENHLFGEQKSEGHKYKCNECNLEFLTEIHLKEHCRKCLKERRLLKSLNAGNENGHIRHVEQCKKNERLKKKGDTNVDIDKVRKNDKSICTTKEKHGPKQCSHSDNKIQYKCTYKNGKYAYTFTKHSKGDKKYVCKDCDYSTDYRGKLVLHLRGHIKGKLFKEACEHTEKNPLSGNQMSLCDICGLAIDGKLHLKCHVLRKHSDEEKKFRCTYCEYSTHSIRDLVSHHRFENLVGTHNRICTEHALAKQGNEENKV